MTQKKPKILLVGATGFVGQRILKRLLSMDVDVLCYVRSDSLEKLKPNLKQADEGQFEVYHGDLENEDAFTNALHQCDGLIYAASLGFPYARHLVSCCELAYVKRAVFLSTTAIFTALNADSKVIRKAAEERIMASELEWTILRPTMIFGRPGDRNIERLVRFISRYFVLPLPGDGKNLMQPVYVDDVADAAVDAYMSRKTIKKSYNISGESPLSFKEIIEETARLLDKKIYIFSVPLRFCLSFMRIYEKGCVLLRRRPRLKAEQILRLNEDKNFSYTEATKDFGYLPLSYQAGLSFLIKDMKKENK